MNVCAKDELWRNLWTSIEELEAKLEVDHRFDEALEDALGYLDPALADQVRAEMFTPTRSLLTDEICLRVFLSVLRTQGIPIDNSTSIIRSIVKPPSLEIPHDIAERLIRSDINALMELPSDTCEEPEISEYHDKESTEIVPQIANDEAIFED